MPPLFREETLALCHPTEHFTILEPQNPLIETFNINEFRRLKLFIAQKWLNIRSCSTCTYFQVVIFRIPHS